MAYLGMLLPCNFAAQIKCNLSFRCIFFQSVMAENLSVARWCTGANVAIIIILLLCVLFMPHTVVWKIIVEVFSWSFHKNKKINKNDAYHSNQVQLQYTFINNTRHQHRENKIKEYFYFCNTFPFGFNYVLESLFFEWQYLCSVYSAD